MSYILFSHKKTSLIKLLKQQWVLNILLCNTYIHTKSSIKNSTQLLEDKNINYKFLKKNSQQNNNFFIVYDFLYYCIFSTYVISLNLFLALKQIE